jgi:hypothetical protein
MTQRFITPTISFTMLFISSSRTAATESTTVISHLQQCARQPAREFHYIYFIHHAASMPMPTAHQMHPRQQSIWAYWRMATTTTRVKTLFGAHPFLRDKDADEDAAALRLLLFVGGDAD